ncbi:type II toxin-antitoxin system HicB family antitoxin [Limnohabitans sp. 63ED37-2]|uniref:type II toxin-antitoxin system HicB family antitoxin n=1 Tax=Limnohabitans sp. 63ED37-2 TaxID=1678128 RepID=UPI000706CD2D|nr:type II toxin-antitoxin system HicB family antitoxin [Limnohabitans sp. 63ED37-2]ALK89386.1 HicB family protein [Limnohabitans sp. 63ED37-2]
MVKKIKKVVPPFPFEAYSHVLSPIAAEDGGGFMFTMPDIPGVVADGETMDQAMSDGREAFEATVSTLLDLGREVPHPTLRSEDFTPIAASGKFVSRVPRSMHVQLVARAKREGVSLNTLVLTLIAEGLGRGSAHAV